MHGTHLRFLLVSGLHRDAPLPASVAEGRAVAGPELPPHDLLPADAQKLYADHLRLEAHPLQQVEAAGVGPEVVHDLGVVRVRLRDARRPREVGEPERRGRRLEFRGPQGVRPDAADAGGGLEDDRAEALLDSMLAGNEAAYASPNNAQPLITLHVSFTC